MNSMTMQWAQSCITSVGFPTTIEDLRDMLEGNRYRADDSTDMDCLLNFRVEDGTSWTAPKWITEGDLLFFYHTQRAGLAVRKLLNQARRDNPDDRRLIRVLERAAETATLYSGTIFGCAEVSGATEYLGPPEKHFKGRLFAPLGRVHIFDKPLPLAKLTDFVKISQNTITPVYSRQAVEIRKILAETNTLPTFVSAVTFGDNTFRNVNGNNWADISCLPGTRFINESQLREYLLDHFLAAVKDAGSPLLEETHCYRASINTGIADYFVKIGGTWVPVEAKLSVLAERDIFSQVEKYLNIERFIPTKGTRRGKEFKADRCSICLVADQSGVYIITSGRRFLGCDHGQPIWTREILGQVTPNEFKEVLKKYLGVTGT